MAGKSCKETMNSKGRNENKQIQYGGRAREPTEEFQGRGIRDENLYKYTQIYMNT